MTADQLRAARHALGLPNARKRSYRNRYIAPKNNPLWSAMVDQRLARIECFGGSSGSSLVCFALTLTAALTALEPGESLDPEDFEAAP